MVRPDDVHTTSVDDFGVGAPTITKTKHTRSIGDG
jgi:hypothetical protein